MKIIHCSDVHLGASMKTHLTLEQAEQRRDEILSTFIRMVDFAKQENINSIIIAGDLLDTDNGGLKTRNVLIDLITNSSDIDFYYLCGNHDENSLLLHGEELPKNLKIFGSNWTSYDLGDITISGVILGNNNLPIYQSLNLNPNKFNIVVLHGGDVRGNDYNTPDTVNLDALKHKNIDYLALGHLHSYRLGRLDERATYAYSGCLEGRGFDECGQKGFILLDIQAKHLNTSFIPFARRTLEEIKVDITNLSSLREIKSAITSALEGISKDSLIRIVFTGSFDEQTQKYLQLATTELQNQYFYVQIKDKTTPKLDLDKYRYDLSIAGEFVRTVRASDLSKEEQDRVIVLGLRTLNGEEVEL